MKTKEETNQSVQVMDEVIEELKKMSNNYQVLDGQYVISKNVLDVFIEYLESQCKCDHDYIYLQVTDKLHCKKCNDTKEL
jgi:hypothetical protein